MVSSDAMHPAALDSDQLLADCEVEHVRRSGPGGQHRNKVQTGVVLRHRTTGIRAEAAERRSQAENLGNALARLRIKLALEVRRKLDERFTPSPLWQGRCRDGRLTISTRHAEFPALLAEALDVVADSQGELTAAAARLTCTSSQLAKLLKAEPRAWQWVNQQRCSNGLRPLH